jgi:hypothetical protein
MISCFPRVETFNNADIGRCQVRMRRKATLTEMLEAENVQSIANFEFLFDLLNKVGAETVEAIDNLQGRRQSGWRS